VLTLVDPEGTDSNVIAGLLGYLPENGKGKRISVAGGAEHQAAVEECGKHSTGIAVETVDLDRCGKIPMRAPGFPLSKSVPEGLFEVPLPFQRCDSVIVAAPLRTHHALGVSLSFGVYLDSSGARYGKRARPPELAVDLFSLKPPEFVLLGGEWAVGGDGSRFRRNGVRPGDGGAFSPCEPAGLQQRRSRHDHRCDLDARQWDRSGAAQISTTAGVAGVGGLIPPPGHCQRSRRALSFSPVGSFPVFMAFPDAILVAAR